MTGSSTGRRHLSAAGHLIGLLAFEVAVITEDGPGDPGELVGERDGEHVGMQSPLRGCNPLLEPVTLPRLRLDQDDPSRLDKQNAQVAIDLPITNFYEIKSTMRRFASELPSMYRCVVARLEWPASC